MFELLVDPQAWISLLVLSAMEIVLGIDNIVFITILCGRLPPEKQLGARRAGLAVALISRILLLFCISWVLRLENTLFTLVVTWSGKDLILLAGGGFLLYKATTEIYENVEHPEIADDGVSDAREKGAATLPAILFQVLLLDVVFSIDSVITSVGMADHLSVMVAAMIIAVGVMLIFAGPVGDFVQRHPSVRVLALTFLVLIGVMLIIEATGQHVSKGYIYSAMGFSLGVEMLNMRLRARRKARTSVA